MLTRDPSIGCIVLPKGAAMAQLKAQRFHPQTLMPLFVLNQDQATRFWINVITVEWIGDAKDEQCAINALPLIANRPPPQRIKIVRKTLKRFL